MSGSKTAKDGFRNEYEIVELINDGNYKLIQEIKQKTNTTCKFAKKIAGTPKTDLQMFHDKGSHNASVKKFNKDGSFNHLARTSPKNFCEQNGLGESTRDVLSIFTGDTPPI